MDVAEETRRFVIEKERLLKNNSGRITKQRNLYDYVTSPERLRKIWKKIEAKSKLEELIRKQEDYNRKAWSEQKKIIKESFDLEKEDQERINDITQRDEANEGKDGPKRDEENR